MSVPPRINYLSNKELLIEIHKSKLTYCSLLDPEYQQDKFRYYDIIVGEGGDQKKQGRVSDITEEMIQTAKANNAERVAKQKKEELLEMGFRPQEIQVNTTADDIKTENLVFRVMTDEHIPPEYKKKKKNADGEDEERARMNFPPFKHYILKDGQFVEVLRSHWKGDQFCTDHGKITHRLAFMFMKLVDKYSQRGNWRGYTYIDEMKSQALVQLSQVGLQFDESRSITPNPFAYYTAVITASFTRVLNIEKKNQSIRDDMLQAMGHNPSFTRQIEHEYKMREMEKNYREE